MPKYARIAIFTSAWTITRIWALMAGFQHLHYPNGEFLFSDVQLYDWWGGNLIHGHFPLNDPMWQYPPLAALIFGIGYSIAPQMVGFCALALVADFALFVVLFRAQLRSHSSNDAGVLLWVCTPLLMGPILLGRFDVFPTLLTVLALLSTSPISYGAYAAVGALLKVWPGLALIGSPRNRGGQTIASFALAFIGGSYLLRLWWPDSFTFLSGQKARGLQIESVGALPYILQNTRTHSVSMKLQYGAMEVIAPHTGLVSAAITFAGIWLFALLAYWRVTGQLANVSSARITLTAVLISMVTSRVLSPQYNVWILGILCVCLIQESAQVKTLTVLICTSAFAAQIVYPWQYQSFMSGHTIGVLAQLIRIFCLVSATVISWRHISHNRAPKRPGRAHQEAALAG